MRMRSSIDSWAMRSRSSSCERAMQPLGRGRWCGFGARAMSQVYRPALPGPVSVGSPARRNSSRWCGRVFLGGPPPALESPPSRRAANTRHAAGGVRRYRIEATPSAASRTQRPQAAPRACPTPACRGSTPRRAATPPPLRGGHGRLEGGRPAADPHLGCGSGCPRPPGAWMPRRLCRKDAPAWASEAECPPKPLGHPSGRNYSVRTITKP